MTKKTVFEIIGFIVALPIALYLMLIAVSKIAPSATCGVILAKSDLFTSLKRSIGIVQTSSILHSGYSNRYVACASLEESPLQDDGGRYSLQYRLVDLTDGKTLFETEEPTTVEESQALATTSSEQLSAWLDSTREKYINKNF